MVVSMVVEYTDVELAREQGRPARHRGQLRILVRRCPRSIIYIMTPAPNLGRR